MGSHTQDKRYVLRIELDGLESEIWREVIVPESISLGWLHEVIQETMGWMDVHLHQFEHNKKFYGIPDDDDWAETKDASKVALNQLLKKVGGKLSYTYDFGDDWTHSIRLKQVLPPDPDEMLCCVAGEGACPPEDCGGIPGYIDLCELRAKKARGEKLSAEEAERLDWADFSAGDNSFDKEEILEVNETLQGILKYALPKGGLGPEGAPSYEGVFKNHEIEEDDDDEFGALFGALSGGQSEPDFGGPGDEAGTEPDVPEPYSELSESDETVFRTAMVLAHELRALEPWKKLYDSDLFGIEDPESGDIAIVSVLGANKEVFALHVHRPPHGFQFWKQALAAPGGMSPDSILQTSSIIEAEFRNKSELEDPDRQLYRDLAIDAPPKGPKKWVLFRNYRPRTMPWFPKADDLPLLIRALRLTPRYLQAMADSANPADFRLPDDAEAGLPTRLKVFQLKPGADAERPESWQLNELPIDWDARCPDATPFQPSEFELQQLADLPRSESAWELGAIVFPSPVMTEAGPVMPLLAMAVDTSMGAPPVPHLSDDPDASATQAIWNCLQERVLEAGSLPTEIHVATDAAQATLADLEKLAGIRVIRKPELALLGGLFQSMSTLSPDSE
ncbi:MAG TPA: plasmid pRiA4b ORF-3 family protein [Opitutales bacterium]|nr:plasmid pRiA4b ORF-3 family protein [Opitutales bacterium]